MSQKVYFVKEIVSGAAIYDSKGVKIPWKHVGGDHGIIELDSDADAELIADIRKLVGSQGIRPSTGDEQSLLLTMPVHRQHDPRAVIRAFNPPKSKPQPPGAAVAGNNPVMPPLAPMPRVPGAPISVPPASGPAPALTQEPPKVPIAFKPKTARVGAKKPAAAPVPTGG